MVTAFSLFFKMFSSLLTTQSQLLTPLEKKACENIVGKGENTGNQYFLLFLQCFQLFPTQISILESQLFCHLQML